MKKTPKDRVRAASESDCPYGGQCARAQPTNPCAACVTRSKAKMLSAATGPMLAAREETARAQAVKSVQAALEALRSAPPELHLSVIVQDCDAAVEIDKARARLRDALQLLGPLQGRSL